MNDLRFTFHSLRKHFALAMVVVLTLALADRLPAAESKIGFWDVPRHGANFFNNVELKERFVAARAVGVEFVRLAPNKWLNGRPESRRGDFLLGPPETFSRLDTNDVALLRRVLDDAHAANLKVVLTMLSLPGSRWRQHNAGKQEFALWQDFGRQPEALECWRQLASALHNHPAVVGYNLLNEPCPERAAPPRLADWFTGDYEAWQARVQGTPADLSAFYDKAVRVIREVDGETPIILDSGFYATPWAFKVLRPVADAKTLYSFHFYEPFAFTNQRNQGRYAYPGRIPTGEDDAPPVEDWDRARTQSFLKPVNEWQQRWRVPPRRMLVGEVGVYRRNDGAARYLDDALSIFAEQGWHWAFYSFREDNWDGMDYELGETRPNAAYWQAIESGRMPGPEAYRGSTIFDVICKRLGDRTPRPAAAPPEP
jgi:endoglucanase